MKANLKQWRLWLGLMLIWALLFLAFFSYFMESHVDETLVVSHTGTHHFNPVQVHTRSVMVATRQTLPATASPMTVSAWKQQSPSSEQRQEAYTFPNAQKLAAWSAFGTQDVGSISGAVTRRRERHEYVQKEEEEEDLMEEDNYEQERIRMTKLHLYGRASVGVLSSRLQKAVKAYMNDNKHGVVFKGKRHVGLSRSQLLCEMRKSVRVKMLDGTEQPFSELGWQKLVPKLPFDRLYGTGFGSCAVVTSAGAILRSGLGREIDSHDAVLRFNSAPTKGYERDVGNKTTVRIINSQIVANPKYNFNTSSLYKNVTLVAWDPPPYNVNLHKWYSDPDYNLFTPYTQYRQQFPAQPFYILHPKFIWQLWDLIQRNTLQSIQPNPPSSGFIGILMMMSICEEVHVYEYIPSLRRTDLCHYHERYYDSACTLGAYHPLLYEKMLIHRANYGSESDLQRKGKVTLPGFSTIHCDP